MASSAQVETHVRHVRDVLREYAGRGVFRSLSDGERRGSRTTFTMVWHHGLIFRFVLDTAAGTVAFPALLPGVPARSSMARELQGFLEQFQTRDVPVHRRIDPAKARLHVAVRGGSASLALSVRNRQFEYATRRLVHLAQEVFMVFLPDGPYADYRVEKLGVNPDIA
jgi:hypothetical protein